MKFTSKPKDFREKNVLRKRIIPDIVSFENVEDILENSSELKSTVNIQDNDKNLI